MNNIKLMWVVFLFVIGSSSFSDVLEPKTAQQAYDLIMNTNNVLSIKTEAQWNELLQNYINKFGDDFLFVTLKNSRGRSRNSNRKDLINQQILYKMVQTSNKDHLLVILIDLYESNTNLVLRKKSIPFVLSGIFYDNKTERVDYSPMIPFLKTHKENLPIAFIEGYAYRQPLKVIHVFAKVFGKGEDEQMVENLVDKLTKLWNQYSWPKDVTSIADANKRATKLLLSIAHRDEWWLQLFLKRILEVKPEWGNSMLKQASQRAINYPKSIHKKKVLLKQNIEIPKSNLGKIDALSVTNNMRIQCVQKNANLKKLTKTKKTPIMVFIIIGSVLLIIGIWIIRKKR